MKDFILLLIFCHVASPVIHSLKYFHTGSSGVPIFPEFVVVGMVDELQFGHYDSNTHRVVLDQDWMEQLTTKDPQYTNILYQRALVNQQSFKSIIPTLKQLFNQTGAVHVYQRILGCDWDDETGETNGYNQYGYDGEDFISLDLKTRTWIAPKQQAVIFKMEWDANITNTEFLKTYLTQECIDYLKKFLSYGKSVLQSTERPSVSLLQKSPSSPVSCHATGFYPDSIMVMWRKDGEKLQDYGELLPNHDGTFQKAVDIDLTGVPPGDWGKYECVVQQRGVDDIITKLDQSVIMTNSGGPLGGAGKPSDQCPVVIITTVIVVVAVLVAMAAAVGGFMLYKKKGAKCPQPVDQRPKGDVWHTRETITPPLPPSVSQEGSDHSSFVKTLFHVKTEPLPIPTTSQEGPLKVTLNI